MLTPAQKFYAWNEGPEEARIIAFIPEHFDPELGPLALHITITPGGIVTNLVRNGEAKASKWQTLAEIADELDPEMEA